MLFCDDLSFDHDDTSYKSLKAALEGGIEGRPDNVIFYATSNRRHLLPRDMIENERSTAINPSEAVEEKVSLSDRFGLWLGFHKCCQDEYLGMVDGYAAYHGLDVEPEELRAEALEWATTRGAGRAASPGSSSRISPAGWARRCGSRRSLTAVAGRSVGGYWVPLTRKSCASDIAVRRSASAASENASSCMSRIQGRSAGAARSRAPAVIIASPRTTFPLWKRRLPNVA